MAQKKRNASHPAPKTEDKPATLKDLLGEGTIAKLKAQAAELKKEEDRHREEERIKAEEARKAEQKKLDNDFGHLLNTSKLDWHKFK